MWLLLIDALAVYLNFYHQHTITTRTILFVCFSSVLVDHFMVFFSIFCGTSSRENTVPSHISYFIHRIGEFTMLMVGESVLSLSALKNITPTLEFYVSLICGFILTSSIMFIQYSTSVFHAEKHVLRRSGKYGICWFHVKFMQVFPSNIWCWFTYNVAKLPRSKTSIKCFNILWFTVHERNIGNGSRMSTTR